MALSDIIDRIRGVSNTIFSIGLGANKVQWKNNSGFMEARDDDDDAFVNVRGLDPVIDDDLITKRHFDLNNAAAMGVTTVEMPLALVTKISVGTIPNNAKLLDCWLEVTTPYDGGTTIALSRTGDGTVVPMGTADNNPQSAKIYHVPQLQSWGATGLGTLTATITGGPAAGAALIVIAYTTPTDITS